jgi:hypothetical protein
MMAAYCAKGTNKCVKFLKGGVKKNNIARCWWFMLIILATQEAEIRRIAV